VPSVSVKNPAFYRPASSASALFLSMQYWKGMPWVFICCIACTSNQPALYPGKPIDYSVLDHWASHPAKKDPADRTPDRIPVPDTSAIDIFFLYPTSFLAKKDRKLWNASIDNKKVNRLTDQASIKYQASIFNQVGTIYAPRYRQAHYHSYFTQDKVRAKEAFELAYRDVKAAFEYYLTHYHHGRPLILAGHSQGSTHGMRLLQEFFDGKPLAQKLIVAYLPGMPIPADQFHQIPVCTEPSMVGCINSWRTYKSGYSPAFVQQEKPMIVVNPISWSTDLGYVASSQHQGAVLRKFDGGILPHRVDAQIHGNILWVHKPRFPGSFLYRSKNFHIADFNFFYIDIRQNAILRRDTFLGLYQTK
jgi:hypothetical protein